MKESVFRHILNALWRPMKSYYTEIRPFLIQ
jgi:hypothetical protein